MASSALRRLCVVWISMLLCSLCACGGGGTASPVADLGPGGVGGGGAGGSGGGGGETSPTLAATFLEAPTEHGKEAVLALGGGAQVDEVVSVLMGVASLEGARAAPVRVTFARSWLERHAALDSVRQEIVVPVFGLYAGRVNQVRFEVRFLDGTVLEAAYEVETRAPGPEAPLFDFQVESVDPALGTSFLLFQAVGTPLVVDIDGHQRWHMPIPGEAVFPRVRTADGFVTASPSSGGVHQADWLGRVRSSVMDDPRFYASHHNLVAGPFGFLNTASFQDGLVDKRLSVLAEMTASGGILRHWDFDQIFSATVAAAGEDPALLMPAGMNWFHMNAAIYDPASDAILASSRENFVVKVDYATGAIRWILGNPGKNWYTAFPLSLQPLALQVAGDAPIGQHALSLSADGSSLLLFNNGWGNKGLPSVGDSRTYSKISRYVINEDARTAEEVWSFDLGDTILSPICSSAYTTRAGDVVGLWSSPSELDPTVVIVNEAREILFRGFVVSGSCNENYAVEEIPLDDLLLE